MSHSSGRVLVIEDDRVQAEALALVLRYQGYEIDLAATANEGLTRAAAMPAPDVVLVDMGLPDLSGAEVVRRIRISSRVPIILLTAHRNVADKITGLDAGADDYVTKPYEPAELLARIRAQFRRASEMAPGAATVEEGVRSVGGLVIDTAAHRVSRDGKPVSLSAREFDVLRVLSEAPGRVVDRKTIFTRIWGADFYGEEGVLDVYIRRIRSKIEPNASAPSYLHTVRGVGYRLEFEPPPVA